VGCSRSREQRLAQPRKAAQAAAHGPVEVAFVVGPDTVLIDVAGPWEALNDAMLPFHTYTVAQRLDAVDLGGIKTRADYTFENAPLPHVIVVPETKSITGIDRLDKANQQPRGHYYVDLHGSLCSRGSGVARRSARYDAS
jgi:hypothetical protein